MPSFYLQFYNNKINKATCFAASRKDKTMIGTAKTSDLPEILRIYKSAREYMTANGNPTQWAGGYPQEKLLLNDIAKSQLYVVLRADKICGVFAFILGVDPTYINIDGAWISSADYGTIHRIASDGKESGVFCEALDFCSEKCRHLRIDTHKDNRTMRSLVANHGFTYCGVIHVDDGSERVAFERA